jgi:hypothetical protein
VSRYVVLASFSRLMLDDANGVVCSNIAADCLTHSQFCSIFFAAITIRQQGKVRLVFSLWAKQTPEFPLVEDV